MSDPVLIQRDAEHLRLLAIFHYVCAGLAAFFACIPLLHLALGLVLFLAPESFGSRHDAPPRAIGLFIVCFAAVFIACGWTFAILLAFAGRSLARRKRYLYCLVMAGICCVFMPFGTVLGVFSIIVLSRPSVKALFLQPATGQG